MSTDLRQLLQREAAYHYGNHCDNCVNTDEKDQPWHIGYGIDNNYARCLGASIASFCTNNKNAALHFHILTDALSPENEANFKALAQSMHTDITIHYVDTDSLQQLPHFVHLPLATYLRFFFPLLLPQTKRLLYLDADIICLNSADELFSLDLQDKTIAAVADLPWMQKKRSAVLDLQGQQYFNAGVLLIDTARWNRLGLLEKVIELLLKEPAKYRYLDQDALNVLLEQEVFYLDPIYNCIDLESVNKGEIVFLHFAAHPKPWHTAWPISAACCRFNKRLYQVYEDLTPWCGTPLELPHNYKEMKIYAAALRSNGQQASAFKWYVRYLLHKCTRG